MNARILGRLVSSWGNLIKSDSDKTAAPHDNGSQDTTVIGNHYSLLVPTVIASAYIYVRQYFRDDHENTKASLGESVSLPQQKK